MPSVRILVGDCRALLAGMEPASVACVVTSPPYHLRRSYMPAGSPLAELEVGRTVSADDYVDELVSVFHEVRRVMSSDGTAWLNIGDHYAAGPTMLGGVLLKEKDLLMLPAHVAIALRRDGFYLRSQMIWAKPNAQPETNPNRPVCVHESVFMLTREPRYHYDAVAVREPATMKPQRRNVRRPEYGNGSLPTKNPRQGTSYLRREEPGQDSPDGKRHMRNVLTIPTQPYKGAHFAAFPERLVGPCITAGSRIGDTVADPFGGSGTTAVVAHRLGRNSILCELNPDYAKLAVERCLKSGIPPSDIVLVG